ncbi:MAG: hypothetical protein KJO40_13575 [Deltaproteobacteria bacterium]|nr:hypothetical protein [Deltaproteobacteria bacterium]
MRITKHMGRAEDVREMLLTAGVGQFNVTMSIPYMFELPRTSDPYAQGIMQIVQGLQQLLNRRGARLDVDGGLGARTVKALRTFAGPKWYDKTWTQLYADVIAGKKWTHFERMGRGGGYVQPMADYDYTRPDPLSGLVGDLMASPLPWIGVGALVWYKYFRK